MKFVDQFFQILKKYKSIFFVIILYFCFEGAIIDIYKRYIVENFLILFSDSWITELFFYLAFFVVIIWCVNKYLKGFYFKPYTIVDAILLLSFYTYVRSNFGTEFLSLYTIEAIKYFDVIYIILLSAIFLHIFLKLKRLQEKDNSTSFVVDVPITKAEDDILNRKGKALQVARFIKGNHTNSSIAIGVVGKWGDGKTSFMSLVEESFSNNNDYIIVKFRSWLNISVQSIFSDFFSTVENEIKPYSLDVAKQIKKYGKSVLPISKSTTAEFILNSLDLIADKSVIEEFENVDNLLVSLQKRVIIFLDDLDRLQPNEVFEVLKLIRNTASFKTFHYVVGYEKSYIIEALAINKIPNPEKYCDKIFLNEFYLMPIQNDEISNYILQDLKKKMNNNSLDLDKVFERYSLFSQYNLGNIFSSIKNLRDAKRFLNEFYISIEKIKNDVDLGDFIIIKLIKYCYNDVYFLIYSNKNKFIGNEEYSGYHYPGGIRRVNLKKDSTTSSSDFNESLLKKYLLENSNYKSSELDHIRSLFQILLNEISHKSQSLAFGFNHNFFKYFNDEINDSEIPVRDYERFVNSDWQNIIQQVETWKKEGRLFGLQAHLYHTEPRDFNELQKFENYIKLLFYLGRIQLKYFHLDFDYIDRSISNFDSRITSKFYNKDATLYQQFLQNLFYQGDFPYVFEMRLSKYLFERIYNEEEKILTKECLKDFIISRYALFIEKMDYSKDDFFDLFHRSKLKENYQIDVLDNVWYTRDLILPEIIEMSKNAIKKFPDLFLTDILQEGGRGARSRSNENQIIGIHEFVLNIFVSYDEFIEFVRDNISEESSAFRNEFLDFANILPTKNDFISYDFTYLPVKNKFLKIRERLERL